MPPGSCLSFPGLSESVRQWYSCWTITVRLSCPCRQSLATVCWYSSKLHVSPNQIKTGQLIQDHHIKIQPAVFPKSHQIFPIHNVNIRQFLESPPSFCHGPHHYAAGESFQVIPFLDAWYAGFFAAALASPPGPSLPQISSPDGAKGPIGPACRRRTEKQTSEPHRPVSGFPSQVSFPGYVPAFFITSMFSPVSLYDGLFLNFLYRLFSIFSVLKENYRTKGSYPGFGSCFYRQRKHGQIEPPLLGPEHFGFPVSEDTGSWIPSPYKMP